MSNNPDQNTQVPPADAVTVPAPVDGKPPVIGAADAALADAKNQTGFVPTG
jgi:hypothetical protein